MPNPVLHLSPVVQDDLPHTLHDQVVIDLFHPGMNADRFCLLNRADHVGGIEHHLGGDAPPVQTGPAQWAAIDDGHLHPARHGVGGDVHSCARANDDQVIFLHSKLLNI